jgi:hypothetical protein
MIIYFQRSCVTENEKISAGIIDTGGKFVSGVVDTGGAPCEYLHEIPKKFETVLME